MCRDFDRIDDNSSLRSQSSNSHDMFMHDMFRVARYAMHQAKEEQSFWNDRRGNFNLSRGAEQVQWSDMDQTAKESKPVVYPWNTEFDWKQYATDNVTFLKNVAQAQSDIAVEKPADTVRPTETTKPADAEKPVEVVASPGQGFGPVPDELIIGESPAGADTFKAIAEAQPEPTKTAKPEQVAVADVPEPVIRNEKGEKEQVEFAKLEGEQTSTGERNLALADMRDLRNEISKPLPPIEFQPTALDAYQKGLAEKKPVVLIIGEDWCQWCKALEKELAKPEFQQYAGKAIFAKVQPSKDPSAKAIADALEIKNYPAISILEPNPAMIEERGRIVGFMDAEKLDAHLKKLIVPTKQQTEMKEIMMAEADHAETYV